MASANLRHLPEKEEQLSADKLSVIAENLRQLKEKTGRAGVSVSVAARAFLMHRATVHRYISRHPGIRLASGKVSLGRLLDAVCSGRKKQPRGRLLAVQSPAVPRWRSRSPWHPRALKFSTKLDDWTKESAADFVYEFERSAEFVADLRRKFNLPESPVRRTRRRA